MRRTKIVATIGPASRDPETLARIIEAGVDGVRLNFSHGDLEMHALIQVVVVTNDRAGVARDMVAERLLRVRKSLTTSVQGGPTETLSAVELGRRFEIEDPREGRELLARAVKLGVLMPLGGDQYEARQKDELTHDLSPFGGRDKATSVARTRAIRPLSTRRNRTVRSSNRFRRTAFVDEPWINGRSYRRRLEWRMLAGRPRRPRTRSRRTAAPAPP